MKKIIATALATTMLFSTVACSFGGKDEDLVKELGLNTDSKDATSKTIEVNNEIYSTLDFDDKTEYEFATKNLIDAPEELELKDENGNVLWSQKAYSFVDNSEEAPDTVNPSLWENTRNNHAYGLFKVTDDIYQVRGYDMANLTVIKGKTGWIVFDTLMSVECSKAAMELVEKNLGDFPVKAVIISHSHVDHYGGIKGIVSPDEVADKSNSIEEQLESGKVPIIVPVDYEEHAVSENVYAGKAMSRRANYQYGVGLTPSEKGSLAMGIGMGQSTGTVSYISPTYEIKETFTKLNIDGVELEFQLTPNTEAPAEMNTWIPSKKALWVAENCTATLHNLYTLRGAQVRDGAAWAKYITETITHYGKDIEISLQSHNWPHWGNELVNKYLLNTASVYKFINDQTLRYINEGYTSDEISNMIKLPEPLAKNWYTRQYYGTVPHNSKAVYQKYMGWYDANPVHLNPLEPTESAKKWAEYMELDSLNDVLRQAKADFDNGEYQWVAEVTNTIVFSNPENQAARLLCADALEQLAYQAESGTWRNAYLLGAQELRQGPAEEVISASTDFDMLKSMSATLLFDYFAVLIDKEALSDKEFKINLNLTDTKEKHMLHFNHGALLVYENTNGENADVNITCTKNTLLYILKKDMDSLEKNIEIEGNKDIIKTFVDGIVHFEKINKFNIIEP